MGPEIATEALEHLTARVQAQLLALFFFLFKDTAHLPPAQKRNLDRPNLLGEEMPTMQITTCNLRPCGLCSSGSQGPETGKCLILDWQGQPRVWGGGWGGGYLLCGWLWFYTLPVLCTEPHFFMWPKMWESAVACASPVGSLQTPGSGSSYRFSLDSTSKDQESW